MDNGGILYHRQILGTLFQSQILYLGHPKLDLARIRLTLHLRFNHSILKELYNSGVLCLVIKQAIVLHNTRWNHLSFHSLPFQRLLILGQPKTQTSSHQLKLIAWVKILIFHLTYNQLMGLDLNRCSPAGLALFRLKINWTKSKGVTVIQAS